MNIKNRLSQTPTGRALIAYFTHFLRWTAANILFVIVLLPSLAVLLLLGDTILAFALMLPGIIVLAGQANAFVQTAHRHNPQWRDLVTINLLVILSLWVLLALIGILLLITPPSILLAVLYIAATIILMPAPFILCLPSLLLPTNLFTTWRNAFRLVFRYPVIALGLLALAFLLGSLIIVTRGILILALPALWVSIAAYTTHELVKGLPRPRPSVTIDKDFSIVRDSNQS